MSDSRQFVDWLAQNVAQNKTLSLNEKRQFAGWLLGRLVHADSNTGQSDKNLFQNIARAVGAVLRPRRED